MKKLLPLFCAVLLLAACTQAVSDGTEVPASAAPSPTAVQTATPTAAPSTAPTADSTQPSDTATAGEPYDKYDFYTDYTAWVTNWIFQHAEYYFTALGSEEAPVIVTDQGNYGLLELEANSWDYPAEAVEYAASEPFYEGADDAMKVLAEATVVFIDKYTEAGKFYNDGGHINADLVKAQALHTEMFDAFQSLWLATNDFLISFAEETFKKEEELAKQTEAQGRLIHGLARGMVVDAKRIEKLLYDVNTAGQDFLQTNPADFKALADAFSQKLERLTELAGDAAQLEREEIGEDRAEYLNNMVEDGTTFEKICGDIETMIAAGSVDAFEEYTAGATDGVKFNPAEQLSVLLENLVQGFNFMLEPIAAE